MIPRSDWLRFDCNAPGRRCCMIGIELMFLVREKFLSVLLLAVFATGCGSESPQKTKSSSRETASDRDTTSGAAHPGEQDALRPAGAETAEDWFEERATTTGVTFKSESGREAGLNVIIETVGSGVGVVDIDGDGAPDLFCVGGGRIDKATGALSGVPCGLFRNRLKAGFQDVSPVSGVQMQMDYSHAGVTGDINNDGFIDILVTCHGENCLLLNQGDGTFNKVSIDVAGSGRWNTAAAFGDIDRDGSLDLFVGAYVKFTPTVDIAPDVTPPQAYTPAPDRLLLSDGNGRFIDISEKAGIRQDGMAMGVIATDLNDDLEIDFYVANDVVENHLYLGNEGVSFRETGELSGVAFNETGTPEGSMGIDSEDVNCDGLADLLVTNFELEDNSLYINIGDGQFQHASAAFRLAGLGRRHVGFGARLCDFDGDNFLDLCLVNGHVRYNTGLEGFLQDSFLLKNDGGSGFLNVSPSGGHWFRHRHSARGLATGDFDRDGAVDVAISSLTEPVAVLFNRKTPANWASFQLVGTRSPRSPIGAKVEFEAFGRKWTRRLTSGAGYLSSSEALIQCALDKDSLAVDVVVTWPSGLSEVFRSQPSLTESILIEGRGVLMSDVPVTNVKPGVAEK